METDAALPYFLTPGPESQAAYRRVMEKTVQAVARAMQDDAAYSGPEPAELGARIAQIPLLPAHGRGFDATLQTVEEAVLPNFLSTSSTHYLAHLHGPSLLEGLSAEVILSAFNQSMDSWDQSPVATETEVAVVRQLCALFGYRTAAPGTTPGGADGCFTSGGSQSNTTALLLARDRFCTRTLHHDVKKRGLPAEYAQFRLYTSAISHFSMEKSCHLLGLGYDAVVKVPVDSRMRMDVDALRSLIRADVERGLVPFCLVATVGTTDYGSIDDVAALHAVATEYGLWLHADAAYGSALVLSDRYRARMGQLSLCDSITVDFHKLFLLPISCSAVLVQDGADFAPLELHADYLNREEDEEDGYTNLVGKSLQTTRRFDALKVWMAFQSRGRDGYGALVDTCVENAAYVYRQLCDRDGFAPVIEPELSSVVFRVLPTDAAAGNEEADALNKRIRRALLHEKGTVIGQTVHNGRTCLKFTLLNPRLTHAALDALLDTILALR